MESFLERLGNTVSPLFQSQEFLAVVILVAGFIFGILVRIVLVRLSTRVSERADGHFTSFAVALKRAGPVAFWTILIVSVLWAGELVGIQSEWRFLETVANQIPKFILGISIVVIAHLLASALRDVVRRSIQADRFAKPAGTMAYITVLLIGLIIGLQQIGINISFVGVGMLVIIGIILATFGVSFAIGAQHYIANLIARQELSGINVGDRIRIDGIEGTVAEIQRTKVVLVADDGTATVPASRFSQAVTVIVSDQ